MKFPDGYSDFKTPEDFFPHSEIQTFFDTPIVFSTL